MTYHARLRRAIAQRLELKGFDPDEPRDDAGKWTAGGAGAASLAHSKDPPVIGKDVKLAKAVTPEDAARVQKALDYLDKKHIPKGTLISVYDIGNKYGVIASGGMVLDVKSLAAEHPLFMAGVMHHEAIHITQDKTWTPEKKEQDALFKTMMWASMKKSSTPEEKKALAKVIKDSGY